MKPIAPQHDETGAPQGSDADGLIRISAGDNGQASIPGPRNLVSVAVAVAGGLQPLSNFKFATVNSFVSILLEFEPYSAEY